MGRPCWEARYTCETGLITSKKTSVETKVGERCNNCLYVLQKTKLFADFVVKSTGKISEFKFGVTTEDVW